MTGRDDLRACMRSVLDARACNLQQQRILHNPTPECDSLAEHIAELLTEGVPAQRVLEMTRLLRRLAESNVAEGGEERYLAGEIETALQARFAKNRKEVSA